MRKVKGLLAILMAMLPCFGLFAGCSTTTTGNNDDDDSDTSTNDTEADETADIIAEVTAVNEDGTLELSIYEILDDTVEITDYASVDITNYYDSYITETCTIAEDAIITVAADGVLTETTSEEIVAGDILVIYTDAVENITIYHAEEDTES